MSSFGTTPTARFGWPLTVEEVPGHRCVEFVKFRLDASLIKPLVIAGWDDIVARVFVRRSLAYQEKNFPHAHCRWPQQLRAILSTNEMPLATFAAEFGWWSFDNAMTKRVGACLGYDCADEPSLIDTLFSLTKKVTNKRDDATMQSLAHRLVNKPARDTECMDIILDVDEAASCLLRDEEDKLKTQQKADREALASDMSMHQDFRRKRLEVRAAGPPSRKRAETETKTKVPARMELMEQKQLKRFFPSSCALWKSRRDGAWHIKVKEWPGSRSRSVKKHGETQALKLLATEALGTSGVCSGGGLRERTHRGLVGSRAGLRRWVRRMFLRRCLDAARPTL